MYPKVTEALTRFFNYQQQAHNGPDLLARWSPSMETQVNVAAGKGRPVDDRRHTYTDGSTEWFNIRMPKNANTEPSFTDYLLRFPLEEHAEGIGCTGWDRKARTSRWFGFDFDTITGHAAGVGIADEDMAKVQAKAEALPYVEVRKSSGGNGLHLYVYCEGIEAKNHTEHAAIARAVLGMMGSEAGFDFASQVDACGGNMWIWHRKATAANGGFKLLKEATKVLTVDDLPPNWRDHIEVIERRRSKIRLAGLTEENQDPFDALVSSRPIVPKDERHNALIDEIASRGYSCVWVPDHHLLQTHTCALQEIMDDEECRKALKLIGFFKTNSEGKDPGGPNCFLFPLENGAWKIYRFSQGIAEHETWTQDGHGWTHTKFNAAVDFFDAARLLDATENKNGGFAVPATLASEFARLLGHEFILPLEFQQREVTFSRHTGKRFIATVTYQKDDLANPKGWLKNGKKWERVLGAPKSFKLSDSTDLVRNLSSETGGIGWCINTRHGWVDSPKSDVVSFLSRCGVPAWHISECLGELIFNNFRIVNEPFGKEHPTPFHWNRFAAQFAYPMADEAGPYPHYDKVLQHVGRKLTPAVQLSDWCAKRGITDGPSYLLHWCASIVQRPFQLLPMLFFFGPQDSGKSAFHNMQIPLYTRGAGKIDKVFLRDNTFDGEFSGSILGVIEEANLTGKHAGNAYNKIKDITTAPKISIERKGLDAYEQRNCLHLVQTGNHPHNCPVLENSDTRIVCIEVDPLPVEQRISQSIMSQKWAEEAPFFIHALWNLKLPEPSDEDDRLFLPPLITPAKAKVIASVGKIASIEPSERPVADLALRIERPIRLMAAWGWIIKATASEILDCLKSLNISDLPDSPNELGAALNYIDFDGYRIDVGHSGPRRWRTISTEEALTWHDWCESPKSDFPPGEIEADEIRVAQLLSSELPLIVA